MDGLEGRILRDGCEDVKEYFTEAHGDHKEAPDLNSGVSLNTGGHVFAPSLTAYVE